MQGAGAATGVGAATGGADRRARTLPKLAFFIFSLQLAFIFSWQFALFIFSWHAAHADGARDLNPAPAHLTDNDRHQHAHAAAPPGATQTGEAQSGVGPQAPSEP